MDGANNPVKFLVTGGAGFIGSALVEALWHQGHEVICLDNLATGHIRNILPFVGKERFTMMEGDIRDFATCRKAVEGCQVVLHQAALGSVPRSVKDPATSNAVNVSGFVNMIEAARQEGIKRFVYASSSSVYGDEATLPKIEERTGNPLSPYAVTKKTNELYARVYGGLHGMETIGLRYFNVFGRRQDPQGEYAAVIPRFFKALIRHESPEIYGDGMQSRDFTYIDNVVQANLLAAATAHPEAYNTAFNVAYGQRATLLDLFALLREALTGFDPEIAAIQALHKPARTGDIPHSLASISKAERLLGYHPLFDLRSGIKEAVHWYWDNLR